MEYIIIFLISTIIMFLADALHKKNKILSITLIVIDILIISFFAGIRTNNIGTDLKVYVKPIFEDAKHAVEYDDYKYLLDRRTDAEPLYLLVNIMVAKITYNFNVLLFTIYLIIITCCVKGIYDFRDKVPMWMCLSIFLLLFFNRTLNITRQSIAIFIIFANLKYVFDKKYVKYIIAVLIAYGFHRSAFVALILIPFKIFNERKSVKMTFFIGLCLALVLYKPFFTFLFNIGILSERYFKYLQIEKIDISVIEEFIRIFFIFVIISSNAINKKLENCTELVDMVGLEFCLMQIGIRIPYAGRVSLYFLTAYIILIPYCIKNMKNNRRFMVGCTEIVLLSYWILTVVYLNRSETFPYNCIFY